MSAPERCVARPLGGSLIDLPPCLSQDKKLLFCASGAYVRIFSVATGEQLNVLAAAEQQIVCMQLLGTNQLHLITAAADGIIRVWDYLECRVIRTHRIASRIHHAQVCRDTIYLIAEDPTGGKNEDKSPYRLISINLNDGKRGRYARYDRVDAFAVHPSGNFIATISGHRLYVMRTSDRRQLSLGHNREFTTVCFHPMEDYIATGDCIGQIVLWYGYSNSYMTPATESTPAIKPTSSVVSSLLSWHAHAVAWTAFTPDGIYLLSGGEESVLVFWHTSTFSKTFLPRLGSSICRFSTSGDGDLFAIACDDNSVRLIRSSTLKSERTIQGLRMIGSHRSLASRSIDVSDIALASLKSSSSSSANELSSSAVANNNTAAIVESLRSILCSNRSLRWCQDPSQLVSILDGGAGFQATLQMFDAFRDQHVGSLEVAPRNVVSRTDNEQIAVPRITQLALSSPRATGEQPVWMVVCESMAVPHRDTIKHSFRWLYRTTPTSSWQLHTRCDQPHTSLVTATAFLPNRDQCITGDINGDIKVWTLQPLPQSLQRSQENVMNAKSHLNRKTTKPIDTVSWQLTSVCVFFFHPPLSVFELISIRLLSSMFFSVAFPDSAPSSSAYRINFHHNRWLTDCSVSW